jgi:predicted DNA-binding transcriptional regulator YafY
LIQPKLIAILWTMRKASRLFEIIQILRVAKRPVTAAVIAERLEVTVRSIYRDIAALQAMRVPIDGERGIGYIIRPGFDLPPLMFTIEETEAVVLGLALIERTGDKELTAAAKKVKQKIAAAVPAPLRQLVSAGAPARQCRFHTAAAGDPRGGEARARLSRRAGQAHDARHPALGAHLLSRCRDDRRLV